MTNLIEDRHLTTNFMASEFACHCGCGFHAIHPDLAPGLQLLRDLIAVPITIVSGCRCPKQNESVGGAHMSQHLLGNAADIAVRGVHPLKLYGNILRVPVFARGGIGIGNGIVHVDVYSGMNLRRWSYDHHGKEISFDQWEFFKEL